MTKAAKHDHAGRQVPRTPNKSWRPGQKGQGGEGMSKGYGGSGGNGTGPSGPENSDADHSPCLPSREHIEKVLR